MSTNPDHPSVLPSHPKTGIGQGSSIRPRHEKSNSTNGFSILQWTVPTTHPRSDQKRARKSDADPAQGASPQRTWHWHCSLTENAEICPLLHLCTAGFPTFCVACYGVVEGSKVRRRAQSVLTSSERPKVSKTSLRASKSVLHPPQRVSKCLKHS